MKKCPFCAEDIQDAAIVCKHCGRELSTGQVTGRVTPSQTVIVQQVAAPSNGIAAVLSLVIPGAGQMYKGRVLSGFIWMGAVIIGYMMFILPGLVLHFLCVVTAAAGSPSRAAVPNREISPERKAEIDASSKHIGQTLAEVVHPQLAAELHARKGTAPTARPIHFVIIAVAAVAAMAARLVCAGRFQVNQYFSRTAASARK